METNEVVVTYTDSSGNILTEKFTFVISPTDNALPNNTPTATGGIVALNTTPSAKNYITNS